MTRIVKAFLGNRHVRSAPSIRLDSNRGVGQVDRADDRWHPPRHLGLATLDGGIGLGALRRLRRGGPGPLRGNLRLLASSRRSDAMAFYPIDLWNADDQPNVHQTDYHGTGLYFIFHLLYIAD